jgi:hypothetical protein
VVPNGSVGQKQYLQFAGGAVQAFEKNSTDNGTTGKILSNSQGGNRSRTESHLSMGRLCGRRDGVQPAHRRRQRLV